MNASRLPCRLRADRTGISSLGPSSRIVCSMRLSSSGYKGNFWTSSADFFVTDLTRRFISFGLQAPSSMKPAICFISASFMPRVVTAGVPRRMPLAWNGERVSNGIVFLFTVMPASSSHSAVFAGQSFAVHVDQHQMIVRAARDEAASRASSALRPAPWRS